MALARHRRARSTDEKIEVDALDHDQPLRQPVALERLAFAAAREEGPPNVATLCATSRRYS